MKERTYPVAEIFGPTIQGEGVDQGVPCAFVRFGGCDYKCLWCDTPHAVLPENVRKLERLTDKQIVDSLEAVSKVPWVILSGGNPALYPLGQLVRMLRGSGYKVAVETQASRWHPWLASVDRLCFSPKPPSSGMMNPEAWDEVSDVLWTAELAKLYEGDKAFLKIVVFDDTDYTWAKFVHEEFPRFKLFLSAGNDAGKTVGNPNRVDMRTSSEVKQDLLVKSRWLTEKVLNDEGLVNTEVVVQAQHHVLLWGNEQGV